MIIRCSIKEGKDMKRRIFSLSVLLLVVSAAVILLTATDSYADIKVRKSLPSFTSSVGKEYYYSDNNIFYKYNYGPTQRKFERYDNKYCVGNCTWYAYGRASELLGEPLNTNFKWNASAWWSINMRNNHYPYGSEPKVGAIACYATHVAIVEKVVDGEPYVSESAWTLSRSKPLSASDVVFHYGRPWIKNAKGYIYVLDAEMQNAEEVDYSVIITAKDLNMRTGPGAEYSRIGYVKPGTYKVSHECGNWAKLESNEYWICMDYAQKIKNIEEEIVDIGKKVNYKVKVEITNLNMRTGPATSYKRVGYLKPGTYKLTKTKNGWGKVEDLGYWISLEFAEKVGTSNKVNKPDEEQKNDKNDKNNKTDKNNKKDQNNKNDKNDKNQKNNKSDKVKKTDEKKKSDKVKKSDKKKKTDKKKKKKKTTKKTSLYKVKVTAKDLYMRTGPGTNYSTKGYAKKGRIYDIKDTKNGWGKLSKNGYWIKLSYTTPVDASFNVRVKAKDLNMRTGPGSSYKRKGYIKPGVYTIQKTKNGWGQLRKNGYWIKLSFTKKL